MAVRYAPELVEEIRSRVDIVDVVSQYVRLRPRGRNLVGLCPFHAEKTPSFTVNPEKQLFHCFGCHAGGDVFAFLMKRTGVGFAEAVEQLAQQAGIDVSRLARSPVDAERERQRRRLLDVHRLAAGFYRDMLQGPAGRAARAYLERRGLSPAMVERFQLGFAPAGDALLRFLERAGITPELAMEAGLLVPGRDGRPPYPRFRERIMFPIADQAGRVIGFGGRLLAEREGAPKYLNSPETPLFSKGRTLYGLHLARETARRTGTVVVVEGYMDCISLCQHGVTNVVASLGTAFTEFQAQALARVAERVVIAFDADAAGEAAAQRTLDILRAAGLRVAVMPLPPGQDPDEFARTHGREALVEALANAVPLTEYKLNLVLAAAPAGGRVEDKARAVEAALQVIAEVESAVEREGYMDLVARRLGVAPEAVRAEMARWQARRGASGALRHRAGKIRHNNRGFLARQGEHTSRGPRAAGGDRLASAEQVVLRHILAGEDRAGVKAVLDEPAAWSSPVVAAAARLLATRDPAQDPVQWLAGLPDSPPAHWLRTVWGLEALAEVPWPDALRRLKEERLRRRLEALERQLAALEAADEDDAGMLCTLLVEYKRLRSDLLEA
ncbi:MAG TPA: DNA primase [Limnochordales bacterium]